ncbi:hypothetical protein ACJJTC_017400 [Scirpophaga incertulas]
MEAFRALALVFAYMTSTESRETSNASKSAPTITSSLVNFGKMDISLHFGVNDRLQPSTSHLFSKADPIVEPCPCSGLRSFKDPFFNNPSDVLSKILMSNDLFSYNKEPMTSTLCCDSHEHDDFVTFELGTKHFNENSQRLSALPFVFENLLPKKPKSLANSKTVEIFMLPKKHSSIMMPMKKNAIQIVGDKEPRNDFKTMNLKPKLPLVSSVKKDLTAQEKNEAQFGDNKEIKLKTLNKVSKLSSNLDLEKGSTPNNPNALN